VLRASPSGDNPWRSVDTIRTGYERCSGNAHAAAARGLELMKMVYSSEPDLIVLDVGLPDVDGRDLFSSLEKVG
jgi:DNA-binding response OmpR family regulator